MYLNMNMVTNGVPHPMSHKVTYEKPGYGNLAKLYIVKKTTTYQVRKTTNQYFAIQLDLDHT